MRIVWTVLISFLLAAGARATTLVPASLGELTRDAHAVALGRVAAVDGRWSDDHRSIETLVTLSVDSYLKGTFGRTVQFTVPGGSLGRYRTIFVGAPQFAVDERVVVFLAASGPALPHLVGFTQGVFRVLRSPDAPGWIVKPSPALPASALTGLLGGDRGRTALTLDDFAKQVRALAGRERR